VLGEQENANEAIRAASEEIQSSNEELQSTNEELETAKEELQSTNEELITLNEEMANRNQELTAAYNDLTNVLASVKLPIVMLDAGLRIRRITPAAEQVLSLIPADIGRPLRDINLGVKVSELERKVRNAVETVTSAEEEARDRDGNWYTVRITPYLTPGRRIDGAVLTFVDISRLRASRETLARALEYANAIIETTREPVMVLDSTLRVQTVNRAFCETFRTAREEAENRVLKEVGCGEWDKPRLRELLLNVLPRRRQVRDFRVEADFPRIGRKVLLLNARRLAPFEGDVPRILLSIEDTTAMLREKQEPAQAGTPPPAGKRKTSR
jgi:two-component system CheB/CheR fusion protein